MKALVIGGGGFAGGYLIKALEKKAGIEVSATKLLYENVSCKKETAIYDLDVTDYNAVISLIEKIKPDFIYHLAAQSSVAMSWKAPQKTVEINLIGTLNILQALKQTDFKGRLLFIGSGEEYGSFTPDRLPLTEACPLCPKNIYAFTKAEGEGLCMLYNEVYGLDIVAVRAFNHIGANQSEQFVASDFAKQIAEIEKGYKEPVISVGNLSAVRDFTDVRDVVKAYIMIMEKGYKGEVYNVGGTTVCSIGQLLEELISQSKVSVKVVTDENKFRPVDIPAIYSDIEKLKKDTGYEPEYNFKQTLSDVLCYWRKKVDSGKV